MKFGLFQVLLTTCQISSIFLLLHEEKTFLNVKVYSKCFPIDDEEILSTKEATIEKPTALPTSWMQKEESYYVSFVFEKSDVMMWWPSTWEDGVVMLIQP